MGSTDFWGERGNVRGLHVVKATPNVANSLDGLTAERSLLPAGLPLAGSAPNGVDGRLTVTLGRNRGRTVVHRERDQP